MIKKIIQFYVEGFQQMKLGKILWAIIGIKLFVMFAILKLFFFPDTIKNKSRNQGIDKSEYVANEFLERVPAQLNDTIQPHSNNKQTKI